MPETELRGPLVARSAPLLGLPQSLEDDAASAEPELASLCFVVRIGLRSAVRRAEPSGHDVRLLLVACDVLRERMLRAIDAALSRGRPADVAKRTDARSAACARALYARLRDVIESVARTPAGDVTRGLASLAVAMNALLGGVDDAEVRRSDRFVIESFHRRILEWGPARRRGRRGRPAAPRRLGARRAARRDQPPAVASGA